MDQALRPERFETLPNSSTSAKEYKHWFRTFENFVKVLPQTDLDKLSVLIIFLSPDIFEYISDCGNYENAVAVLDNVYIKPMNEAFARRLLSVRKQKEGESLDEYLQSLKSLSKDCNFQAVNAVQHKEQYIRDACISGSQSNAIRQRLLENNNIDLDDVFHSARSLEIAQKNVEFYTNHNQR